MDKNCEFLNVHTIRVVRLKSTVLGEQEVKEMRVGLENVVAGLVPIAGRAPLLLIIEEWARKICLLLMGI